MHQVPVPVLPLALAFLALGGCVQDGSPPTLLSADGSLLAGEHRSADGVRWRVDAAEPVVLDIPAGATLDLRRLEIDGGPGLTVRVAGLLLLRDVEASGVRVVLEPGGQAVVEDSELVLRRGGIVARNATLDVAGTRLADSTEEWLRAQGSNVTVTRTTFEGSGGGRPGIVAVDSVVRIADSSLSGAAGYGVQATGGLLRVERTTVASSSDYGLQAAAGRVELQGNRWEAFCGVFLGEGAVAAIAGDRFVSEHRGLTLAGGRGSVEGASFAGVEHALRAVAGEVRVANTTFSGNGLAVEVAGGNATVEGNRFSGNGAAVQATPGTQVRGNAFEGSRRFAVHNTGNGTLDAAGNWWGSPSGPGPADLKGSVAADPWLREAPDPREGGMP